jgi:hypothetical protein
MIDALKVEFITFSPSIGLKGALALALIYIMRSASLAAAIAPNTPKLKAI